MMAQAHVEDVGTRSRSVFGWKRLAVLVGIAAGVGHAVIGAVYPDLDALAIAVSFAIALGLLGVRRGPVGLVMLGLASANVAFWTIPASLTNLGGRAGFWPIVVPGTMAVLAMACLVAVVGTAMTRRRGVVGETAATRVALVVTAGLVDERAPGAEPGDLELITDRNAFSDSALVAMAGPVGVHLENHDYFWHTFTITELGVDLRVPVGASGRVTFEAAPGTYDFVCAVPGHQTAGMVGTLTVVDG